MRRSEGFSGADQTSPKGLKLFLQSLRPVEAIIVPTGVLGVDSYVLFKPLRE